jgi:asparagine synthase (glutamine-hydrolysing)
MGRIAAILSKGGKDVSESIVRMLRAGNSQTPDAEGIATGEDAIIKSRVEASDLPATPAALGYVLNKIEPEDPPQPVSQHDYTFIFEGRLWRDTDRLPTLSTADTLGKNPEEGLKRLIKEGKGSFSLAALIDGAILGGRDPVGTVPLYFGGDEDIAAMASCMKMLWAVGLDASIFKPGSILRMSERGTTSEQVRELVQPPLRDITMDEAASELDERIKGAVSSRVRGLSRVSLGFSGGIDSSVLAYYMDKAGVDVDLVCVGLEGSREFELAEIAADSMDIPLRLEAFTAEDVENDIDTVLCSIEEPDQMKASVAIPLHWAARSATENGIDVFFSGNGSDELFGGYHRHAQEFEEHGDAVVSLILIDVRESYRVNYERDHKVCMDAGLELRLPFSNLPLVEWGLAIPPRLKLSGGPGSPRKLVLRSLARRLGLTEEISMRPKKAIQYSTGVNAALRKIAKREGKSLQDYLSDRFKKLKAENLWG